MAKDMARRHRIQAGLSVTGATLGLSALGTKGGAAATRSALKRAPQVAEKLRLTPKAADNLDKTSLGLVTTGAGVGGVSGLTFAANERALARREEKVAKSAFGVVHKAVVDMESKRAEADARRAKAEGMKDYRNKIAAGKFVRYEDDVDDEGKKMVAPPQQRKFKMAPKPAAPPKRKRYSGLNPEDRRQRRMKAEQYGLAGGAAGSAGAAGVLGYKSRQAGQQARRIGSQNTVNERVISRTDSRIARARTAVDEIGAKASKYTYKPKSVKAKGVTVDFTPKPYRRARGVEPNNAADRAAKIAHEDANRKAYAEAARKAQAEADAKIAPSDKVKERRQKTAVARHDANVAAAKKPFEQRELRATARHNAAVARSEKLVTGYKAAARTRRLTGRAAVVAGGTALALGAGAVGVRHMRRNQGRTYRDWWDG